MTLREPVLRDVGSRLLAVILGLALSALILEGGVRMMEHFAAADVSAIAPDRASRAVIQSADPALIFELNPGWSDGEFTVNSRGMADEEYSVEKNTDEFRIAFVGDSITCGFRLRPREQLYLNVVEDRAGRVVSGGSRIRCLNFGVNGYGVLQVLRMAQSRVPQLKADLVVAQLCLNDPYPSGGVFGHHGPTWRLRSLRRALQVLWPRRFWAIQLVERTWIDEGHSHMSEGIRGFSRLHQSTTPTLLVLFPYLDKKAYRSWGFGQFHEEIRSLSAEHGVPFLDLREAFQNSGLIRDRWPMDPLHPSAEGHRVAADEILEKLAQMGWLPRAGDNDSIGPG